MKVLTLSIRSRVATELRGIPGFIIHGGMKNVKQQIELNNNIKGRRGIEFIIPPQNKNQYYWHVERPSDFYSNLPFAITDKLQNEKR